MKRIFLNMFLLVSTLTIYGNNIDIINRAIDKIDYKKDIFKYESEIESIGRKKTTIKIVSFDPNREPQFKLELVNGEEPSKKDLKNYIKQKDRESGNSSLKDLLGSKYTLLSNNDGIGKFSYITAGDIIPKKESKMNGEIWINMEKETVIKVLLINPSAVSITVGVSISQFQMEFNFEEFNENISVLSTMNMSMKGKAVLVEFDQVSRSKMYNYTLVK